MGIQSREKVGRAASGMVVLPCRKRLAGQVALALTAMAWGGGVAPVLAEEATTAARAKADEKETPTLSGVTVSGQRPAGKTAGGLANPQASVSAKMPLSLREIPESVTVITRERMDAQGVNTVPEALNLAPGINVINNDTLNYQYYARGYGLGAMFDGVAAFSGMQPSHQFDLAAYEQLEVLRGPSGLMRGVGEPGGLVNFVKKRPGDTLGGSWTAKLGSNGFKRGEADVTGPLNEARTLRGRLVVMDEDRNYFYDHTHSQKWLGQGALELDLSPNTLAALTFTAQDQYVKAPWSGLPAWANLTDPNNGLYPLMQVSPSTFNVPDWGHMHYHTEETAARLEHHFESGWTGRLSLNHRYQTQDYKYAYSSSAVNPNTNTLSYTTQQGDYGYTWDGVDVYGEGPFQLLGRRHQAIVGYNAEVYQSAGMNGRSPATNNVPFANGALLPEPTLAYTSGTVSRTTQGGLYGMTRLSLTDPLTLVLGGRMTTFKAVTRARVPSSESPWKIGANAHNEFTPYGALLYDLGGQHTLYGSYTRIFIPQTVVKADGSTLDPRTGRQFELGLKSAWFDGRMDTTVALFNLRDKNRAFSDPAYPNGTFYIAAGEIESKGVEMDVSGQITPNLDVTLGYTYLITRYLKDAANEGLTYSIQTPRNQFRLWTRYRFDGQSPLAGWNAGLGVIANGEVQSTRGWRNQLLDPGYVVVNAQMGYEINKTYSLDLHVNNLFNRNYYASVGTPNIYNFYGEPRNFMLTLRAKY